MLVSANVCDYLSLFLVLLPFKEAVTCTLRFAIVYIVLFLSILLCVFLMLPRICAVATGYECLIPLRCLVWLAFIMYFGIGVLYDTASSLLFLFF